MKSSLILMAIACSIWACTVNAQIQRNNFLVGGDIANFDLGLRKGSVFTMRIDPKLAFFIQDNIALGGYIDLGLISGSGVTTFDYGVGVLGRYYFAGNNDDLLRHSRFFAEANAGITGQNVSHGGSSTNGLGLGFGPGLAYFLTRNIGLETLLKYNGLIGFGNATTQSDLRLNIGFQIYLPTRHVRLETTSETQ